jgi:hypothetical protein
MYSQNNFHTLLKQRQETSKYLRSLTNQAIFSTGYFISFSDISDFLNLHRHYVREIKYNSVLNYLFFENLSKTVNNKVQMT